MDIISPLYIYNTQDIFHYKVKPYMQVVDFNSTKLKLLHVSKAIFFNKKYLTKVFNFNIDKTADA